MGDNNRYKKALANEGRDLIDLAYKSELPNPLFRDRIIKRILEAFGRKRSVLLVGPPGVGKTAIIYGLAHEMRITRHRGLRELSTIAVLRGTHYLGDWQSKVHSIIDDAKKKNIVLYFTDVWNMRTVGSSSNDPSVIFDAFQPYMLSGEILVLGELSDNELAGMQRNPQLISMFEQIQVDPLTEEECRAAVEKEVERLGLPVLPGVTDRILKLCRHFMPHSDGPGPALQLIQQVAHYHKQKTGVGEPEPMDTAFVEKVFSIYSGLPLFVISHEQVKPVNEMRAWFRERVIGQSEAIETVLETIALYKAGLHDSRWPIGTFLFVGPTGVGKTELAKALAVFLFGSETRLLRFDMSEFKDYHAYELLLGSSERHDRPARLIDPVKGQPFQVILFDEIEKAHANIWDILLQLLAEGRLTAPRGGTVNFRNTIIIATSNAGAREMARQSIGFTGSDTGRTSDEVRQHLEHVFRPELINRFQHIVPFYGLDKDKVKYIARRELQQVLMREGIAARNLIIDVGDDVIADVVEHGYDERYGARALKRELQRRVVLPIANYLLENKVYPGAILKLGIAKNLTRIRLLETEESRAYKQEDRPVRMADRKRYTLAELHDKRREAAAALKQLGAELGETELQKKIDEYHKIRNGADFWADRERAYQIIVKTDELHQMLTRISCLRDDLTDIETLLKNNPSRHDLQTVAHRLMRWEEHRAGAWRELVVFGEGGNHHAIVQIEQLGDDPRARDLLFNTYSAWAQWRQYQNVMLCEPLAAGDPAGLLIKGPYAYGMLKREAGLHRLRDGKNTFAARVTLAPLTGEEGDIKIERHDALKKKGQYGGKVRSRLEISAGISACSNLVIQNANILAENYDLAGELGPAWLASAHSSDEIVRRYDLNPFRIRDSLLKINSGRQDQLKPPRFHELLCKRVDMENEGPET